MRAFALSKPQDPDTLHEWVRWIAGVYIPRTKVCDHHDAPFDAFCDAYFGRAPGVIVKGSRGLAGKTFLDAVFTFTCMITLGAEVTILGGSEQQSKNIQNYLTNTSPRARGVLWEAPYAPTQLLAMDPTQTMTKLKNGGGSQALPASQRSVRGPHPQILILDELDEMEWEIFLSALGQPMDDRGIEARVLGTSTHQHPDGTMTKALQFAEDKSWKTREWCVAPDTMVSTPTGRRRIDEISAGDTVYGFDGLGVRMARVDWCGATRTSPTCDILLSNGRRLRCTPEHLVLTEKGWTSAEEIVSGDRIMSEVRSGDPVPPHGPEDYDRSVPVVLQKTQAQEATESLLGLRQGNTATLAALPKVLHQVADREEQDALGSACYRESQRQGLEEWQDLQSGEGCAEVAAGTRNQVAVASANGSLRDGHSGASRESGCGCSQSVPPQLARGTGSQQAQESRGEEAGLRVPDLLGGREAPVVEGAAAFVTVVEVLEGPELRVWDMCVPGLDSFVAEGVVAHNCYKESAAPDGWLTQRGIDVKRSQTPDERWRIEYDLGEPSMDNRIFSEATIEALFDKSLGEFDGTPGEEIIVIPPRFMEVPDVTPPGHLMSDKFSTGVDWGNRKDFTVVQTMQHRPLGPDIMAAWGKWHKSTYHRMADRANSRIRRYGGTCYIDGTGLGVVMEELMDVPYEAHEFSNGKATREMYNNWVKGCQQGEVVFPYIKSVRRRFKYLTTDMLYYDKHTPDEVVAAALQYAASREALWMPLIGR